MGYVYVYSNTILLYSIAHKQEKSNTLITCFDRFLYLNNKAKRYAPKITVDILL